MREPILRVEGLRVAYRDLVAVWDASLTVHPGELTVLVGRNGAGKTSFLSGVAGLIRSSGGSVELDGRDVTRLPGARRVPLGMALVQEGKRVFRKLTVRENLVVSLPRGARHGRAAEAAIREVFEIFPALADRPNRTASELSGGQQQMLAIGSALVSHPRVLLLDEPSSGLAPVVMEEILAVIAGLKRDGLAVVLVEQLLDEIGSDVADRVAVMDQGRIVLEGGIGDVSPGEISAAIGFADQIAEQETKERSAS